MRKVKLYTIILLYWIVSMLIVSLFTLANLKGFIEISNTDISALSNPLIRYWTSPYQILEATFFGVFFGILFIIIHEISEQINLYRKSFGQVILIKSLMYLSGFVLSALLVYSIVRNFEIFPDESFRDLIHMRAFFSLGVIAAIILIFLTLFLNFVVQAIVKFGQNNLLNFLTGRYQKPVLEDRVFLFMDLKSSTTIAEELGSIKYSELIKDCFADVNKLVDKYRADIYQYVGDEVVLTWKTKDVLDTHYHIKLYHALLQKINKRKDYYLKKYGLIPDFKAGVHGGFVTVAEIGNIKRDIAYHGDVLNTASRIQDQCNKHGEHYLISGDLIKRMGSLNGYKLNSIGRINLKGKSNSVEVHAIEF